MHTSDNPKAGMSLIEVLIAVTLLAIVFGALSTMMHSGTGAFQQGVDSATASTKARRGLDRIASQFGDAELLDIAPQPTQPLGSSLLTFHRSTGAAGGVVQWGPNRSVGFQYEASEADDGLDNDGDGLIDEGRVVLIENIGMADQRTTVLCPNVREYLEGEVPNGADDNGNGLIDEQGLSFELVGETLVIRLTVEQRGKAGNRTWRTVETSVWVRN